MKNFYFILLVIFINLPQLSIAQGIWARTFSGAKDAIVHSFVDEQTGDVYIIGSNGYDNVPVTSAEDSHLPIHFVDTTTGIGQFVAKFDKLGNMQWYRIMGAGMGVPNGKVMLTEDNRLVVLLNNHFHVLNATNGRFINSMNYPHAKYKDFDLIKDESTQKQYIVGFHLEVNSNDIFSLIGIYNIGTFAELATANVAGGNLKINYQNGTAFKLHAMGNSDFILGINIMPTTTSPIPDLYIQHTTVAQIPVPSQRYFLMKFNVDFNNNFEISFENEIGQNYGIYDYDITTVGGEYKIFAPASNSTIRKIKENLTHESSVNTTFSQMYKYCVTSSGHLFSTKSSDPRLVKLGFNGIMDWDLQTRTFETHHITSSDNYDITVSGWYTEEVTLGDNLLPSYGGNNWYKSAILKVKDAGNSGIYLKEEELQYSVYPNPASEFLQITSNSLEEYKVLISNNVGRLVYESKGMVNLKDYTINIANQKPGMYYIFVTDGKNSKKIPLMIK